ncbi:TetR/AcrR family transcriptional regulator [Modestobacter sp. L9-4]|uniref:TetR/AcrR family transcriptional regulator n=1 Tax=Modestobacter sp. L9-4 TaxID=2851567 RepID=UPI001C76A15C|nr:TetR/AcrR family transcriptional regulator [Modestobacter sp. L9-4]QXG76318.1 TetR/AcrR family transcriptional regulator [Modestobacter sp. L9-4]
MPPKRLTARGDAGRDRLVTAARALFAERGLAVTQADVAARAGTGVASLYRRFGTKDDLILAAYRDMLALGPATASQAASTSSAWQGLVHFVSASADVLAGDRGLRELVLGGFGAPLGWARGTGPTELARVLRDTDGLVVERLEPVVRRAQADGDLRPDVEVTDVQLMAAMVQAAATLGGTEVPGLHRRAVGLLLDGLRVRRDAASALPVPAMTLEQLGAVTERAVGG